MKAEPAEGLYQLGAICPPALAQPLHSLETNMEHRREGGLKDGVNVAYCKGNVNKKSKTTGPRASYARAATFYATLFCFAKTTTKITQKRASISALNNN